MRTLQNMFGRIMVYNTVQILLSGRYVECNHRYIPLFFVLCLIHVSQNKAVYTHSDTSTYISVQSSLPILVSVGTMLHVVGPCHHGMARPQVADGGTASNMEGS